MEKTRFFNVFMLFILLFSVLLTPVSATVGNPAVSSGCHSVDATMTLGDEGKIVDTAKAVVLYELNSGTMLYTWNPDEKIYPTSMVKMMTTLVALENCDLDETVTIARSVLNQVPIGILGMDLKAGEEITLRDLLYGVMVASATDAAVIVANHVAGSTEAFLELMNAKAAELGCRGTHYGNVHGLHDEQTYTTARDICRITEVALQNETFRTMFRTATYTIPETNKKPERDLTTTNHMMNERNKKYYDPLVTGGKTGATDQGGRCLTLTAEKDGMELLCVLMGATPTVAENGSLSAHGSFEESKILIDQAFEKYEFRQVFFDGQSLAQYPVANGASHVVTQSTTTVSTILPVDVDETQLRWDFQEQSESITAPVMKGQKVGTAQVWYGTKCLAQTDMVAMNAVEEYRTPVIPEKPKSNQSGSWLTLFLILVGLVLAVFAGMVGIRAIRIRNFQHRQKRRGRRR